MSCSSVTMYVWFSTDEMMSLALSHSLDLDLDPIHSRCVEARIGMESDVLFLSSCTSSSTAVPVGTTVFCFNGYCTLQSGGLRLDGRLGTDDFTVSKPKFDDKVSGGSTDYSVQLCSEPRLCYVWKRERRHHSPEFVTAIKQNDLMSMQCGLHQP